MPTITHDVLREFVYDIYRGAGGTEEDARIVSDHVVDSNLAGHDSHGVINAPNYIGGMAGGPAADKMEIVRQSGAATVINANGALGMVAARKAMEMAVEKAESCTIGAVGLHRCGHAGRMGRIPTDCGARRYDRDRLAQRWWTIYASARWDLSQATPKPDCDLGATSRR